MKIFKEEKLEQLISTNWTEFTDTSLLRSFVKDTIQKNLNNLNIIPMKSSFKGNSLSLSRFYFDNNGYYFWIEFHNLVEKYIAEGTIEAHVPFENDQIKMVTIIGSLYHI
jgi:hypothetical protein